jgi:hypothetical protein
MQVLAETIDMPGLWQRAPYIAEFVDDLPVGECRHSCSLLRPSKSLQSQETPRARHVLCQLQYSQLSQPSLCTPSIGMGIKGGIARKLLKELYGTPEPPGNYDVDVAVRSSGISGPLSWDAAVAALTKLLLPPPPPYVCAGCRSSSPLTQMRSGEQRARPSQEYGWEGWCWRLRMWKF